MEYYKILKENMIHPGFSYGSIYANRKDSCEKADVHSENVPALIMAAQKGIINIVKYLVEQGADIHTKNDDALR